MRPATELGAGIAGFVAAEGTFTQGAGRFAFAVTLGGADADACLLLQSYFGVGRVRRYRRRQEHYQDEIAFVVRRLDDLVHVIEPFMEEHLPPCHKRQQFEAWREELLDHWERTARRRRLCQHEGCTAPLRARGLCRTHYYAMYGR